MVELVEGTGGAARRRSPLENFWTLGVALAAGVTIAVAAVVVCGGSMRPTRVSLMSDEQVPSDASPRLASRRHAMRLPAAVY
jgi:hypothetical protein